MHALGRQLAPAVTSVLLSICLVGNAHALDKCAAQADAATGFITVSARSVNGTLAWGRAAGNETSGFVDAACVAKGKASGCVLADQGLTPLGHFDQCFLFLADDADRCEVAVQDCVPSASQVPKYFDDFEAAGHAWSPADTGTVPGSTVLGGYCNSAGPFTRVYALNSPHTGLRLRATLHQLDDWQGEVAWVAIDGSIVWTRSYTAQHLRDAAYVAGNPTYSDRLALLVDVVIPHAADRVRVEFGSTLGAVDRCTASLAIDDVFLATF